MIYVDNAATTKMSGAAINAMTTCMQDTWGNPSSLYSLGQRAKEALEDAKRKFVGPDPKILALPKTFKVGAVHLCMADDDLSGV